MARFCRTLLATAFFLACLQPADAARHDGVLTLHAVDQQSGQPLAVRMVLTNQRGRPVRLRPPEATLLTDGLYFAGDVELKLKRGDYAFVVEAGPEYQTRPGSFSIDRQGQGEQTVELLRRVDLAREGWYAGDVDLQIPLADASLAARARGVAVAPVTAAANDRGKCIEIKTPERVASEDHAGLPAVGPWTALDSRRGEGLLLVGGERLVDVCGIATDASCTATLAAARAVGARTIARSSTAWQLPIWVASGQLDAVVIAGAEGSTARAAGRPAQEAAFRGPSGRGRYAEAVYHHLLNCGLRLAPVGASGAGRGATRQPIGSARTYVWCGDDCTLDDWLAGLSTGKTFVTNGPLLRTRVAGHPPGHVFELGAGEIREFQIGLDLAFYEQYQVDYLEIVKNGEVLHEVRLDELARQAGRLPVVRFEESGWFLVRAVTNNAEYYQFATTGAYFVEANYQPRVSRASVAFFLDWLDEAAVYFADDQTALEDIRAARPFWESLRAAATAE